MEKFTKGPWFVSDGRPYLVIKGKVCANGDDGEPVVVADTNHYFSEARANAALIAAAPDMYKELNELKDGLDLLISKSVVNVLYLPALHQQVESINALLKKARGEA